MLTNNAFQAKINSLRVVLNLFYIYLISHAFQYVKQVIFQYPHSFSIIYIYIRSLLSTFCILFYSILILYSLWSEHVGTLLISIILFIIFFIIRLIFDLYGYSSGSLENSLYPPFESIRNNLTKINNDKQKPINEELTDFSIELMMNIIGTVLTIFIIIRMRRKKWKRKRQMELEALRIDIIRRQTF